MKSLLDFNWRNVKTTIINGVTIITVLKVINPTEKDRNTHKTKWLTFVLGGALHGEQFEIFGDIDMAKLHHGAVVEDAIEATPYIDTEVLAEMAMTST